MIKINESDMYMNVRESLKIVNIHLTSPSALISWLLMQGCELIGRPEKVSIGDQLETTFEVKWRPFGYHFEDGWRPIIKLSVVSSNIGSNNFGLRKMALLYLNLASLSLIFNLYKVYKNQNYNLSNIKEYSIIVC